MAAMNYRNFSQRIAQNTLEELVNTDTLLLGQSGNLSSYYAPYDAINLKAKAVLVGICPGKAQWRNALQSVKDAQQRGCSEGEILKTAKAQGAFSGPMRRNLIQMLDYAGLAAKLELQSTACFFEAGNPIIHMTSVLRHCILNKGENYTGSSPGMLKDPFLKQHIEDFFIPEIQSLPNAVYIPLGKSAADVLYFLSSLGYLNEQQILDGFPHPSGANAERIKYFLGEKSADQLSAKTNAEKINEAKKALIQKIKLIYFK